MFLLTRDERACRAALERLRAALGPVSPGPIILSAAGDYTLGWFRARRSDNLHVYRDGYLVGKLVPGEPPSEAPIVHGEPLPADGHPLARAVAIAVGGDSVRVRPFHTCGVYTCDDSASDMQLLLADRHGLAPSEEGVALLATAGCFPGELTLFREVRRVPFLHAWTAGRGAERVGRVPDPGADDRFLIDRLVGIVPRDPRSLVAISGGADSRFVLGILLRAGISPELIRLSDDEDALAKRLAGELELPLRIVVAGSEANLPAPLYTAMTDGQIYYGGGHYARLREALPSGALLYAGLLSDSMLKNGHRSAWKRPRPGVPIEDRLVREGVLSRMRDREPCLVGFGVREELFGLLRRELAGTWDHGEFATRKQKANWFHYLYRGLRWSYAHTADLDFYAEVVLLLSDLAAQAAGMRSPAWENFRNDRIRRLNHMLLPGVTTGYANGLGVVVGRGPAAAVGKVYYEFGRRGLKYMQGRRPARGGSAAGRAHESAREEAPGLGRYFSRSLDAILADADCSASLRRAALTVNEVLAYLGSGAAGAANGRARTSAGS